MLQVGDLHIFDSLIVAFLQSSIVLVCLSCHNCKTNNNNCLCPYHTSGIAHSYTSYSCYLLYIVHFFCFSLKSTLKCYSIAYAVNLPESDILSLITFSS